MTRRGCSLTSMLKAQGSDFTRGSQFSRWPHRNRSCFQAQAPAAPSLSYCRGGRARDSNLPPGVLHQPTAGDTSVATISSFSHGWCQSKWPAGTPKLQGKRAGIDLQAAGAQNDCKTDLSASSSASSAPIRSENTMAAPGLRTRFTSERVKSLSPAWQSTWETRAQKMVVFGNPSASEHIIALHCMTSSSFPHYSCPLTACEAFAFQPTAVQQLGLMDAVES